MHRVEALRLPEAHPDALRRDNPEPVFFEPGGDLAGEIGARRVRLDHRKGALNGHFLGSSDRLAGGPLS
jgi:hypothetical protein